MRHMSMESLYEYGSRAGFWRVLACFEGFGLPLTVFAVARALARNPAAAAAIVGAGHEVAGHGLRWLSYQLVDEETERAHLAEAVRILTDVTGTAAGRVVHGEGLAEHPPPGRRARRLPLRRRLVRRRPSVLDVGRRPRPSGRALRHGHQRHALRQSRRFGQRRPVRVVSVRRVRRAVAGGRGRATRRCCRSGCTAVSSAAPAAWPRWPAPSTTCSATSGSGCAGGPTSPATGRPPTRLLQPERGA